MPKTKGCGTHLPRSVDCPSRQAHQGRSGASIAPTHGRFDDAVRAQPAKGSYDPSARLRRLRRALAGSTALVAVALVGTLLVAAPPAFADDGTRPAFGVGGTGGVSGVHGSQGRGRGGLGGGSGGNGGATGGAGSYGGGGGGGTGGANGGAGGADQSGSNGGGGTGGIGAANYGGLSGGHGGSGSDGGGGGGGGGGLAGYISLMLPPGYGNSTITGGSGGRGGDGSSRILHVGAGGGGGGAGGYGVIATLSGGNVGTLGVNATGGKGGNGGDGGTVPLQGAGYGGGGGSGGAGLLLYSSSQATVRGNVHITGGNGGNGGGTGGGFITTGGSGGIGGVGLLLFNRNLVTVGDNAAIAGGNGGNGGQGSSYTGTGGAAGGVGIYSAVGASINNGGSIIGGYGGAGSAGSPGLKEGVGGAGGTGGAGVSLYGNSRNSLTNASNGTISGGRGGAGGFGGTSTVFAYGDFYAGTGGTGGAGGAGLNLGNGITIIAINNGRITAGTGGSGGTGGSTREGATPGNGGTGGTGGSGVTIGNGAALNNAGTIDGGTGGQGGTGGSVNGVFPGIGGNGGNGGSGGTGVTLGNGSALNNTGTINGGTGGQGGAGGSSTRSGGYGGNGGTGGTGGTGVYVNGGTLTNSGTITGGAGGGGGAGGEGDYKNGAPGSKGPSGTSVMATNGTVINSGKIVAGRGANAITFNSGRNRLELWQGSIIKGAVDATKSNNDTLALGGVQDGAFDVGRVGDARQYRGFEKFEKTATSTWTLIGTTTATGPWTVNQGTLTVNGSLAASSQLTINAGGLVSGSGTLPHTTINGGTMGPGNSIGTINVQGNFEHYGGNHQLEINPAGQSDRVAVTGTATINGPTVQVLAAPGSYGKSTTYTIVNAKGGLTGGYGSVIEDFAFLAPSLSYDANNAYLTLALGPNAFASGGITPNQKAVGAALDASFANAGGDFATVIGALAGLTTAQGPAALNTISGQPWANFGTMNIAGNALFMNALGQQMALARGAPGGGQRLALAEACDAPTACQGTATGPWSAWVNALGGLGSVLGDGNAGTLTYNLVGAAAGLDYRFDPRFLVGLGVGYAHGTQWTNGFMGQGFSDSVSVAAYASFSDAGFYVDALAGYAYSGNQLERQIMIPNLQPRTANGSTGANQFLGQVETGYKLAIYAPAQASVTPFGRLQISSVNQNGFTESGAGSLSLDVAQQTTTSVRSTLGADLAGRLPLGPTTGLDVAVRLGWMHELADTSRPITAAFTGAPTSAFTVFGATPARDSAVIGFQASTAIAEATSIYLRYDGQVGGGTDNHALNIGVRMTW